MTPDERFIPHDINLQPSPLALAIRDVVTGFKSWRIWFLLALQDIKLRYRRSYIGPLWITLSMGIMIYTMGFLYGKLFKSDLAVYYPFLASGVLVWTLIATIILETNDAFYASAGYIKQIKLPYSIYILRVLARNFIIFAHNLLAVIPILIYFGLSYSLFNLAELLYGLCMLFGFGFSLGMIFAIMGTRFIDIKQIVVSLIQIVFMLTPIMWMPNMLPERFGYLAVYNPFYQVVNLVREPLTGHAISAFTLVYTALLLIMSFLAMFFLLRRARHRIAFWV